MDTAIAVFTRDLRLHDNPALHPLRQAQRFDRAGAYVRRYVPELADLDPAHVQVPWRLPAARRERLGYPDPIVELS